MQELNRILPRVGPEAFKTYELAAPAATHYRPATCAEVNCQPYEHGWLTTIEKMVDPDGRLEAVLRASGRRFTEQRTRTGIAFTFPPGQPCLAVSRHRVPLEREPFYLVRGGDWRGNPIGTPTRQHANGDDWVSDFGEHQGRIAEAVERG